MMVVNTQLENYKKGLLTLLNTIYTDCTMNRRKETTEYYIPSLQKKIIIENKDLESSMRMKTTPPEIRILTANI